MNLLLKNGVIATAAGVSPGDVGVAEERICAVGPDLPPPRDCEVIDLKGAYLLPGGVDVHTHFDMDAAETRTADDFESGTAAAVAGGTTTILDFAEPAPGAPLQQGLEHWHQKAGGNSYCDYGFHMTVTHWDADMPAQMESMVRQGVASFKLYTAYAGMQVTDDVLYHALKTADGLGAVVCVHCENGSLAEALTQAYRQANPAQVASYPMTRPPLIEKEAVSRVLDIARLADADVYLVHLSCADALREVREARRLGVGATVETCPHYLLLEDSRYRLPGFEAAKYVMAPPLRKEQDTEALWKALENGEIQTVATDHCAFNWKGQKELGRRDFTRIPGGIPSVEHRLSLLYTYGVRQNRITLPRFVELTSTGPAKRFGLYPQKGEIAVGCDADLVVLRDIGREEGAVITAAGQAQRVDYTPYEGFALDCRLEKVFLRGRCVAQDGRVVAQGPSGRFLHRDGSAHKAR